MYKVYKITDTTNGKIYIGMTRLSLNERLRAHASDFNASMYEPIRQHGLENFEIEPIGTNLTKAEALRMEARLIVEFNSMHPDFGYNKLVIGAIDRGEYAVKRTNKVEPLRTTKEIEEMKDALLSLGGKRDLFLFVFGINTGLRISDILPIKVGQVRAKPFTDIIEQKTEKKRRIYLLALQPDIIEYTDGMDDDEFLFPSRKGNNHITRTQAYRIMTRAGDWIGRDDIGTHTMRKTFGYHYYKKTLDIATLMEIFGHSAPSITKRYIGIREDEIADSLKDFKL